MKGGILAAAICGACENAEAEVVSELPLGAGNLVIAVKLGIRVWLWSCHGIFRWVKHVLWANTINKKWTSSRFSRPTTHFFKHCSTNFCFKHGVERAELVITWMKWRVSHPHIARDLVTASPEPLCFLSDDWHSNKTIRRYQMRYILYTWYTCMKYHLMVVAFLLVVS